MSVLEEKLIELGYYQSSSVFRLIYEKTYVSYVLIIELNDDKIIRKNICFNHPVQKYEDVEKAYNIMRQDLEVLKEYER